MTKKHVKVLRTTWLDGPSIWTYKPAIETLLDIQDLEQYPSNLLPGFTDRLIAYLPGLYEHQCGVGVPGGFIERLRDGTYAAHILEHITIELHNMIGQNVKFGKARMASQEGVYKMVFHTTDRKVGLACFESAMRLLHACIEDKVFDMQSELAALRQVADRHAMGHSTREIVEAARRRKIPVLRMNNGNLIQLGQGCKQEQIWGAETSRTSAIADGVAGDEELTRHILGMCGVPVPDEDEVADIEAQACIGENSRLYRLLIMKGQLVAASRILNNQLKNELNNELNKDANKSSDARSHVDVTAQVHADIVRNASLAAKLVGLNIAGVDVVCDRIDQDLSNQSMYVLRLACRPDLSLHSSLNNEDGQSVADMIIDSLFEENEDGRIPVVSYSGGPESLGLGQAIHAMLTMAGHKTALSSKKGLNLVDHYVDHSRDISQTTNWFAGRRCLISKQVEAAVMRVDALSILSEGLPFDRSSVAVLTSLGPREGLEEWDIVDGSKHFNVMRTVVDVVLSNGCAVLNADDVGLLPIAELCDGEVIWFAGSPENGILQEHFRLGGRGVYLLDGMIHYQTGTEASIRLISMSSFKGLLSAEAAMAAIAAAWALNVTPELIHASLAFYLEKGWAKNPSNQRVET
jgi:cyanophycin synthetase